MNHEQLVKHYTELLEAKDRGEQWAIDEYDKPMNQEQYAAFLMLSVIGSALSLCQTIIRSIAPDRLLFLEIKEEENGKSDI